MKKIKKAFTWLKNNSYAIIPSVVTFMLIISSNSTTCWYINQPKAPKSLKKYRSF